MRRWRRIPSIGPACRCSASATASRPWRSSSAARSRAGIIVSSAVPEALIHDAIGDQLTCVFVDHGLLRLGEAQKVVALFRDSYNIPLVHVEAEKLFLDALAGVDDPEIKRKIIGRLFIDVFEAE